MFNYDTCLFLEDELHLHLKLEKNGLFTTE
jgi:hypothetical protein